MTSATANQPFVFTPGAAPTGAAADPLVDQTRREIAEIVREVAAAVRSDRSADEFLSLLVDRILRAMAAEGVIVWRRADSSGAATSARFDPICRIGRITDATLPAESLAVHDQLLVAVASEGQPVVVPATPGATDPQVPANPMHVPVALVPIDTDHSPEIGHLLEVFLESDCGVATTRGYLRFVAQMADLAGEFLRADQLRRLRRSRALASRVDEAVRGLHQQCAKLTLEASIVDSAAELFGFDRVGLCYVTDRTSLAAVSHVSTIDSKSAAADQLRGAANSSLDADGCFWSSGEPEVPGSEDESLVLRSVVGVGDDTSLRLVCFQLAGEPECPTEHRDQLVRFARHAEIALRQASRWDAIPGSRLLASLAPKSSSRVKSRRVGRLIKIGLAATVMLGAFFPLPLNVHSTATIRPADVQTLCAPRDAMVQEIHVAHGQSVRQGDTLVTLSDPVLEEQIASLKGERAVLEQKRTRLREKLVDYSSQRAGDTEQTQSELLLVAEEIQSTDQQLDLRERINDSLVIRADRDGYVDAWQIRERLDRRPLQRGDLLLKVIAQESAWHVDVRVPQSRISHVQDAWADNSLDTSVALAAQPNQVFAASLVQVGPASKPQTSGASGETALILRLSDNASTIVSAARSEIQSGAPARVMFHCGSAPAGYLLFQDLIRSVRGSVRLYLSSSPPLKQGPGESS